MHGTDWSVEVQQPSDYTPGHHQPSPPEFGWHGDAPSAGVHSLCVPQHTHKKKRKEKNVDAHFAHPPKYKIPHNPWKMGRSLGPLRSRDGWETPPRMPVRLANDWLMFVTSLNRFSTLIGCYRKDHALFRFLFFFSFLSGFTNVFLFFFGREMTNRRCARGGGKKGVAGVDAIVTHFRVSQI